MNTKKKILIGIGIFLLILIITNPSKEDFQNFIGYPKRIEQKSSSEQIDKRVMNFLIFSIYEHDKIFYKIDDDDKVNYDNIRSIIKVNYLGIFKNFIHLYKGLSPLEIDAMEKAKADSVIAVENVARATREAYTQDSLAKVKMIQDEIDRRTASNKRRKY